MAKIDETIRTHMSAQAFGLRIRRRVRPSDLYHRKAGEIFVAPIPALDRAIRFGHRDLLLSGIAIDPKNPFGSVQTAGLSLGRAFWHYSEARDRMRNLTGREVRPIGLIYNGVDVEDRDAREGWEYVKHIWRQDADRVVRADNPLEAETLRQEVEWLTG